MPQLSVLVEPNLVVGLKAERVSRTPGVTSKSSAAQAPVLVDPCLIPNVVEIDSEVDVTERLVGIAVAEAEHDSGRVALVDRQGPLDVARPGQSRNGHGPSIVGAARRFGPYQYFSTIGRRAADDTRPRGHTGGWGRAGGQGRTDARARRDGGARAGGGRGRSRRADRRTDGRRRGGRLRRRWGDAARPEAGRRGDGGRR